MPSRQLPPPAPSPSLHRNRTHSHHHLVPPLAAATVSLSVFLVLLFIFSLKLSRNRTAPAPPSDLHHSSNLPCSDNQPHPPPPLRRYSYSVLRRATSSFAASNCLGQGGFGSVYRGVLPSSGESVAVKLMDTSGSLQGEREFQNELSLASRINYEAASCSRYLVRILGYSTDDRRGAGAGGRKLLVYELMSNGSLQEKLLDRKCAELMDWGKRFQVVLGVAKALEYLHFTCGETPVIHGDVKPSNVLLDEGFNVKLGDFGLSRVMEHDGDGEDDGGVLVEKEAECRDRPRGVAINGGGDDDDDGSIMVETENAVAGIEESIPIPADRSPRSEGFEKSSLSESCCLDKISVASEKNRRMVGKKKGKGESGRRDWWWKQDSNGGLDSGRVTDYVMEWIGNEIKKETPKSESLGGGDSAMADDASSYKVSNGTGSVKVEPKKNERRLDWWGSLDKHKLRKKEKNRKPREWWKEEFCEELERKKKKNKGGKHTGVGDLWWQTDEDFTSAKSKKKKNRSRSNFGSIDWWLGGLSGELGGDGGGDGRRHINQENTAGSDVPKSGGISSTPSMRGTVCYIAPEYAGGGQVSEKCDVYSFGVLILVVLSGRRPLQVMASPMSEFDRANLISWARQLAHNDKLLDLVDPMIQSLDREQALLCTTIALLCLRRSPGKRPNMKDIVEMLTGVAGLPHLPLELSWSPPLKFSFKSRIKAR